ncbi:MAG: HAD family hydrolase [Leptolyngbyaceae cyanobacterium MO_188.B28]|nr:HAD family hydrolase [Leptolyngbyaceae cyanobacterium MO_188.B28]
MPKSQALETNSFVNLLPHVQLIATDMDGTLTQQGQFTPRLLQSLQDLAAAGLSVVIVTGRSAGWVNGLAHYLPVAGAIAENGGLFYPKDQPEPLMLSKIPDLARHRRQLADFFQQLQRKFPHLQESTDNRFRLTDWTFDVQGLSQADLQWLNQTCQSRGWGFTYSTVQCHIKPLMQDKAIGLQQVLQKYFPQVSPAQVLTVGDSPNDESLFDAATFPHSVGVANVAHYVDQLTHQPAYMTDAPEVAGFCQLVERVVKQRGGNR